MAVPVKLGPTLEAGLQRKLFDAPTRGGGAIGQYSVAHDGSRFLMIEAGSGAGDETSVVRRRQLGFRG
jgi:hypothetical protein